MRTFVEDRGKLINRKLRKSTRAKENKGHLREYIGYQLSRPAELKELHGVNRIASCIQQNSLRFLLNIYRLIIEILKCYVGAAKILQRWCHFLLQQEKYFEYQNSLTVLLAVIEGMSRIYTLLYVFAVMTMILLSGVPLRIHAAN